MGMGFSDIYSNPEVKLDGTVRFPGLDFEGSKLTLHQQTADAMIVHVSGGSGWNGVGQPRAYSPAHFIVLRRVGKKYEYLCEFPIKRGSARK